MLRNMSSEDYVKMVVQTVKNQLKGINESLPTKCKGPLSSGYHPVADKTLELDEDGINAYQELIGFLRWAIEI